MGALVFLLVLTASCGGPLDVARKTFGVCMSAAGFSVTSVEVGERPTDAALSFGFAIEGGVGEQALEAAETCTEQAAGVVGRKTDF